MGKKLKDYATNDEIRPLDDLKGKSFNITGISPGDDYREVVIRIFPAIDVMGDRYDRFSTKNKVIVKMLSSDVLARDLTTGETIPVMCVVDDGFIKLVDVD